MKQQMEHLQAFGLHIGSELAMPELQVAACQQNEPQVHILMADLTEEWEVYGHASSFYAVYGERLYLHVPELAIYCVEGGRTIRVSPMPHASATRLRMYVLGSCMGVLLMQRGILPLHGSAVLINGKAYAFVGQSGAGKSTLAAAFVRAGYSLISDDVIAVNPATSQGSAIVSPAYPQQKLWQTSLEQLGFAGTSSYTPLYETKYAVPTTAAFHASPVPLGGVFELDKTDGDEVRLEVVSGMRKLPLLHQHTYRHEWIPHLGYMQWHLDACVAIGRGTPVYRLQRPTDGFHVEQLIQHVLENVQAPLYQEHVTQG